MLVLRTTFRSHYRHGLFRKRFTYYRLCTFTVWILMRILRFIFAYYHNGRSIKSRESLSRFFRPFSREFYGASGTRWIAFCFVFTFTRKTQFSRYDFGFWARPDECIHFVTMFYFFPWTLFRVVWAIRSLQTTPKKERNRLDSK